MAAEEIWGRWSPNGKRLILLNTTVPFGAEWQRRMEHSHLQIVLCVGVAVWVLSDGTVAIGRWAKFASP
jgi:hypothetical protein